MAGPMGPRGRRELAADRNRWKTGRKMSPARLDKIMSTVNTARPSEAQIRRTMERAKVETRKKFRPVVKQPTAQPKSIRK